MTKLLQVILNESHKKLQKIKSKVIKSTVSRNGIYQLFQFFLEAKKCPPFFDTETP